MPHEDKVRRAAQASEQGQHLLATGEYVKALELFTTAAGIFEQLADIESQAHLLNNIGLIEAEMAQNDSARSHFRQALELFQQMGSTLDMAQQWGNLGSTYRNMENYDEALNAYFEALSLYESLDHGLGIGDQYTNIAYIHGRRGQLDEALKFYRKALPLYIDSGDTRRIEATTQNIKSLQTAIEKDSLK